MVSEYEKTKQENIAKNKLLLAALGLEKPLFEPKEKRLKKAAPSKKRKISEPTQTDDEAPAAKVQRSDTVASTSDNGVRRSSRNSGKVVDYKREILKGSPIPVAYSSGVKTSQNTGPPGRDAGPRKHNPKTFGSIPGIAVGTWWETREGCSLDAIHAPWVGGISGGPQGAHSVALSGGYDDDVDVGYAFTYTGSGGRDLKGTKTAPKNLRTGPQSSDQSFENTFNKMLKRSCETKKPVRVIRGFKNRSPYAPSEGYRYDGLYVVEKAWMEKGLNPKGYLVCKYAFKRLPNQPAIPRREEKNADNKDNIKDEPESTDNESQPDELDVFSDADANGEIVEKAESVYDDLQNLKNED